MRRPAQLLTLVLLILVGCVLVFRDHFAVVSGADKEAPTWGATDPTWSPDGERLAFSLFGSIWQVSAQGGDAEQITGSDGYHAHPAWSPKGDKIAFVKGLIPGGRIPNVSGRLVLVDVATGRERELTTPYPAAGRPSWSPDGTRLVCGLQEPNSGSLLHEINMADGEVTQIQFRPHESAAGTWVDASWSPKRAEIFFAAERMGPPQIWSIPAGIRPLTVQLPLTHYKPAQIVLIDSLSALPDGSGIIYSAVEVNGRGNYELYRISREGGPPESITNTPRDEFAPAVSPDGRHIAYVSNHLGNIDLFTMPVEGGEKKHVRITELKFRRPSGRVRVKVLDEFGKPTAARLYVRAQDGKPYCPPGEPIFHYPLDPGGPREGFFIANGDDTLQIPAGSLRLVALKGIEYRLHEDTVDVVPGVTTEITMQMERWTNWAQRGWYTGEVHFHANYNGSYYQTPKQSLMWLQAEDLNSANMMVANFLGAFLHDKESFTGAISSLSTERYTLYWGQEYRNSEAFGHLGFLNIKRLVPPFFSSVIGSNSPYDFPLNTMAAQEAHRQGGLVVYLHPIDPLDNDVFDYIMGGMESPVTAALGAIDAIEVLAWHGPAYSVWYTLLNAGFRISPAAGTDAFTNWRGLIRVPGSQRQYVETGQRRMSWDAWIAGFREGRVFVTSGPLLTFTVNGHSIGSQISAPSGRPYLAKLATEISSAVPLRKVEFIQNGKVIGSWEVDEQVRSIRMDKEVEIARSSWFAVRVIGRPGRGVLNAGTPVAHSGAVYVNIDSKPTLIKEDVSMLLRWLDRFWGRLEDRDNFGPGDNRQRAKELIDRARMHYREKLTQAW